MIHPFSETAADKVVKIGAAVSFPIVLILAIAIGLLCLLL
jgi:hypothetical protein